MAHRVLDEREIRDTIISSLNGWRYDDGCLETEYDFTTFEKAIAFMVECAPIISREDHHPDWRNVHNRLFVKYCTHDAGNKVTDKDIIMAKGLERIYRGGY